MGRTERAVANRRGRSDAPRSRGAVVLLFNEQPVMIDPFVTAGGAAAGRYIGGKVYDALRERAKTPDPLEVHVIDSSCTAGGKYTFRLKLESNSRHGIYVDRIELDDWKGQQPRASEVRMAFESDEGPALPMRLDPTQPQSELKLSLASREVLSKRTHVVARISYVILGEKKPAELKVTIHLRHSAPT